MENTTSCSEMTLEFDIYNPLLSMCDSVTFVAFLQTCKTIYNNALSSGILEEKKMNHYVSLERGPFYTYKCDAGIESDLPQKKLKYKTLDNGGTTFIFNVSKETKKITVVAGKRAKIENINKILWECDDYIGYWVGKDIDRGGRYPPYHGNNMLVEVSKHKYVWIGSTMDLIESHVTVRDFWSPVGNSAVPYPVIVAKNIIFCCDAYWCSVDLRRIPHFLECEALWDVCCSNPARKRMISTRLFGNPFYSIL
jgi:hypothetical protein